MTVVSLDQYRRLVRHADERGAGWKRATPAPARTARPLEACEVTEHEPRQILDCAAVEAYDRLCRANDTWSEHIPGDGEDHATVAELERAYDSFYGAEATSMEGLRLQFESLVAIADVEGDDEIHPRALILLENMRRAFRRFGAELVGS